MGKFSNRSTDLEIMDDLNCSGEVVHQTLHEIEFINRWLGGNSITLKAVRDIFHTHKSEEVITIADLGCGGGGMLVEIGALAKRMGVKVKLTGIDANPHIIDYARNDHKNNPDIEFLCMDIFSEEFQSEKFDVILCTLVAHHFSIEQITSLFSGLMNQAEMAVVINDLERNAFAYHLIKWLTRLFSKSSMVKYDAPLSVLRGFKRKELQSILLNAGISRYDLSWRWAFRWKIVF